MQIAALDSELCSTRRQLCEQMGENDSSQRRARELELEVKRLRGELCQREVQSKQRAADLSDRAVRRAAPCEKERAFFDKEWKAARARAERS